jgi:hypothetical protein
MLKLVCGGDLFTLKRHILKEGLKYDAIDVCDGL